MTSSRFRSEVAEQIATSLKSALTPAEKARIDSRPTDSVEAYQQFLKGRYFLAKRTPQALRQASDLFEEAVQEDPAFALAWSGLADANMLLKTYNPMPVPEALPKGKAAAQRALELDPGLGEVHASLGMVAQQEWNWEEAERQHRRSIELSPGYATAYHWYGNLLSIRGRHAEAIAALQHALELDPLSLAVHMGLGVAYFFSNQPERALEIYQKALEMDPSYVPVHTNLGGLHLSCGRYEEALAEMAIDADLSPHWYSLEMVRDIRLGYEERGATGFWEATLEVLKSQEGVRGAMYDMAQACVQLGRIDEAFALLDELVTKRSGPIVQIHRDPLFKPLRSDPRFDALLRKIGLA
jgi:tetratricopeptide (TPR) repeat protein